MTPAAPASQASEHADSTALALSLIAEVRPIAARFFRQAPAIAQKADRSPVTEADKAIEAMLRQGIKARFPHHSIIGEEDADDMLESPYTWVLDPIDGTRAFSCGNPMFGTLIAVLYEQKPIIGVIDLPILEQTWLGVENHATKLNGRSITTATTTELEKARLATTSGHALGSDRPRFEALAQHTRVTAYGGDCANYAHLAAGWCDLVAESTLKAHDIMAVIPVIQGAGGVITQWDGGAITLDDYDGTALASANQVLHDKALAVLAL